MSKFQYLIVYLFVVLGIIVSSNAKIVSADIIDEPASVDIYSVYDEKLNLLFQREDIAMGDNYLSEDYKFYEINYIDEENKYGIAKFITQKIPPKVYFNKGARKIEVEDRTICMYMTHNDESYLPTDGVDSIYGNGGIKDVALAFKGELEKKLVSVYLDDTLHIPHDTKAYNRSKITAEKLQSNYKPDAIFDIHRDGASRSFYVTKVDGRERGRVRMVIGKANPNMSNNEEFALYLMSVGKEMYPWLFTDIYYASGHYNQALDSKAILFEMGSHLVEKPLIIESMKELADVVTTAMYDTVVDTESGDLTVNGEETEVKVTVNEVLDLKDEKEPSFIIVGLVLIICASICVVLYFIFYTNVKSAKISTKRKKY